MLFRSTGLSALTASDVVEIVALDAFSPADTVSASVGGTFNDAVTITDSANNPLTLNRTTSDGDIQVFQKDGTTVAFIANSGSAGEIVLNTNTGTGVGLYGSTSNGGSLLPTDETGSPSDNVKNLGRTDYRWKNLYLSGGVYLGGTGSANYLDDYEEGTWTATLTNANSVTTTTQSYNKYVKIGSWVYVQGYIDFSGSDSSSSSIRVSGLPFACASSVTGSCIDRYAAGVTMMPYAGSSQTYLVFYQAGVASSQTWNGISYNEVGQLMAHFAIAYQTTT